MKIPLFIAGGSSERAAVAEMMRASEALGYRITCDWPAMMDVQPADMAPSMVCDTCSQLEAGIDAAYVVWFMLPATKSEGAHYELGYVRGILRSLPKVRKMVVLSGDIDALGRVYPTFAASQAVYVPTHAEVLPLLAALREQVDVEQVRRLLDVLRRGANVPADDVPLETTDDAVNIDGHTNNEQP